MKKALFLPAVLILALPIFTASCGNNGCEETRESYCVGDLRATGSTTLNTLSVWGMGAAIDAVTDTTTGTTTTTPRDTLMIDSESAPTNISLTLNPDTTVTQFKMLYTGVYDKESIQAYDTLTVRYEVHPFFINMECGCSVYFTLREISTTRHFIRNVYITSNEITNTENVNFIIEY